MYAAFKKERKHNSDLLRYTKIDGKISLFGCNDGWIPWLLQMQPIPSGQNEPYCWHLQLEEALDCEKSKEYAAKHYTNVVNAILINVKPGSNELLLCELVDVWGFSADGWTPMLWHLRVLEPENDTKCRPDHLEDFAAENGEHVYEFLYAMGTVKNGKIGGTWIAPKSSPTNAALLWPGPLNYFMECIKGQTDKLLPS